MLHLLESLGNLKTKMQYKIKNPVIQVSVIFFNDSRYAG